MRPEEEKGKAQTGVASVETVIASEFESNNTEEDEEDVHNPEHNEAFSKCHLVLFAIAFLSILIFYLQ